MIPRGVAFSCLTKRVLDPVGFDLTGEVHVQASVIMGVEGFSGLGSPYRMWVAAISPHA